jgi:hypothetical protein
MSFCLDVSVSLEDYSDAVDCALVHKNMIVRNILVPIRDDTPYGFVKNDEVDEYIYFSTKNWACWCGCDYYFSEQNWVNVTIIKKQILMHTRLHDNREIGIVHDSPSLNFSFESNEEKDSDDDNDDSDNEEYSDDQQRLIDDFPLDQIVKDFSNYSWHQSDSDSDSNSD